jgi:hypothetical protein
VVIGRSAAALCVLLLAPIASAQGLGDAARKAEEQRRASSGLTVTKLSSSPLDGDLQEVVLTESLFDQYAETRASIGRALYGDLPLYERVREAVQKVKRQRHVIEIYEAEPKLKAAIEFHGFTVAGFMQVVLTMQRGSVRAHASSQPAALAPLQTANTVFMRQHEQAVRSLEYRLGVSHAWLMPIPSYYLPY